MPAIRRLLVAVKSPESPPPASVTKAAVLARTAGASLELFHALSTPVQAETFVYSQRSLADVQRSMQRRVLADLEKTAARLRRKGVEVATSAEWDFPPHEAIVRRALRSKADLVVAEQHAGRRALPWLLHVTDWELLRLSPVPVLLIKTTRRYRRPALLAALDPTHAFAKTARLDREILRVASALGDALRGKLHAVHAYLPLPTIGTSGEVISSEIVARIQATTSARARTALDMLLAPMNIPASRRHLVNRSPVDAIPEVARQIHCAIVVMGAVSRSGLKRVFIGNTAERVLDDLACDVLVVKPPRFANRVGRARKGVRLVAAPPTPSY